ncbi:MAG: hypothetical protein AAF826_04120 [Pseudomonadota bacterium]
MGTTKVSLLHIGKTGGTFLQNMIRAQETDNSHITFLGHRNKLSEDVSGKFAFVFREPTERFVSGFQSRLRMGRPRLNNMWSTNDAIAFLYFKTPNELAEALGSEDDRTKSAAHFAMNSIVHLKCNYTYTFGSIDQFVERLDELVAITDLRDLDHTVLGFLEGIGIEHPQIIPDLERHAALAPVHGLSDLARKNLQEF